jgi:hypothetical protein
MIVDVATSQILKRKKEGRIDFQTYNLFNLLTNVDQLLSFDLIIHPIINNPLASC